MFWGHPITTGLSNIDYFFSLDTEDVNAAWDVYSEQLVRMEYMNTVRVEVDVSQLDCLY